MKVTEFVTKRVCTTRLAIVVVHVHDLRVGCDYLGDLVSVRLNRQPGADVEELAHARLGREVANHTDRELAGLPSHHEHAWGYSWAKASPASRSTR
jgi:hypothetical protein